MKKILNLILMINENRNPWFSFLRMPSEEGGEALLLPSSTSGSLVFFLLLFGISVLGFSSSSM
jgi:hypothetical protein